MFFEIVLFILCLPSLFLMGTVVDQSTQYSKGSIPSWVKPHDFPLDAVLVKPSQVNLQHLLIDTQRNWEEKTLYCHFAIKTLTQNGIEKVSQLQIDFDPSYTQIVMHNIRVFRKGEWLDRLENARSNLIQRETDLEQNLYYGDFTLVYFLEDIQEGDIVEYAYSLKGNRPLFSSHYTDMVYMQRDFSVEKITHRVLGHPDFSFLIKPINTSIEPRIRDLSSSLREWSWETSNTPPYCYETDQPAWHNPPAHIEMSQYQTWEAVAKKLYPLYTLASDFTQSMPPEMCALIEKWKASTPETSERALLALRFTQDQIRYLGIEEGMGAFQPIAPHLTFQRRFGDCKDKTFLLHGLLQLMEIPSTPLLVHTKRGKRLPDVLPSPLVFDHLVLQLEIDNAIYYVDPTFSLQGGSLQTNFFPAYEWGLLLSNNSKELIQLPKVLFKNPTEIDTFLSLESEDIVHLKIKSVFYGSRADRLRRSLEWNGSKKIEEESLARMQKIYGAVTLDNPAEITDDRENNIVTLMESYRFPTQTLPEKKSMKVFSHTIKNYLDNQINPERASPYQLYYPLWVRERIHVNNPFSYWDNFKEDYKIEHESLLYSISTQIEKNKAIFDLELKHLQDHVPKHSLRDYWHIVNEIEQKGPHNLTIVPPLPPPIESFSLFSICLIIVLCMWPVIYLSQKKSAKPVLALQAFLWLHASLLSYLLFTGGEVTIIEKILGFCVICLYFTSFSITLNKAKQHLLEKKLSY